MSNWLRCEAGNPLDVLLQKEAKTCKGCRYLDQMIIQEETIEFCTKRSKHNGQRCKHYAELPGFQCHGGK